MTFLLITSNLVYTRLLQTSVAALKRITNAQGAITFILFLATILYFQTLSRSFNNLITQCRALAQN